MAACSIDEAIRNAIAVGGDLDHLALLDNFCWCSSTEEERLGQLKAAVKACYDYSTLFGTPFISGKDSMFNDFVGYDENGNKIKISVPPTLLVSSIGVVEDTKKSIDLVPKFAGDLIYVIGETKDELGGSEYFAYVGEKEKGKKYIGNKIPKVDGETAKKTYRQITGAIKEELVASAVSLGIGGLGAGIAKMAIAGGQGLEIDLAKLELDQLIRDDYVLFSESQSRMIVTVDPKNKDKFESLLKGIPFALVGSVTGDDSLVIQGQKGDKIVKEKINNLEVSYKETLGSY
jgi:phosphoribosylformylglycinamidine synthase